MMRWSRSLWHGAWIAAWCTTSLHAQTQPRAQSKLEHRADSLIAAARFADALPLLKELTRSEPTVAKHWNALGNAAASTHDYTTGLAAFERASAIAGGPITAYNAAAMHARLGHTDSAFTWLNRAVQLGFPSLATIDTDDDLASLRGDARFASVREAMTHAPAPCLTDSTLRKFDFWVGSWNVTAPGGQPAGSSRVDIVSGGCALLENWTSNRGGEGKSLNTYNPVTGSWQQYWIGQAGGPVEYRESEWHGRSLSFLARFPATASSPATLNRLTFSPVNDSTVRQLGETSTDSGKTWTVTYDFLYHRRR